MSVPRSVQRRLRVAPAVILLAALASSYALPQAQTPAKKVLGVDDYTKWRTIVSPELSGDGKWVSYVLQLTNVAATETRPVLHVRDLDTDKEVTVANATGGVFSPDSKWLAYQVDPNPGRGRRGGQGQAPGGAAPAESPATPPAAPPQEPPATQPPAQPAGRGAARAAEQPRRVELRNLPTGEVRSWENIGTFTFSPGSTHLVLKRRAANDTGAAGGGRGGGSAPGGAPGAAGIPPVGSGPRGTDTLLLDLRTGRHQLLGSVGDIAFNRTGSLLAYTVDAAVKDGNGLFVFDTRSGRTVALDNDAKQYTRLAWNEEANAIAVLKGKDVEKMREKENVMIVFSDVPAAIGLDDIAPAPVVLDPEKAGVPKGWVVSDRAPLAWSEDNRRVFFGIKEQVPAPDTSRTRSRDEEADVDVWNVADERVQSQQMNRAEADRNFTFRQAFDVAAAKMVRLADETMRDIEIAPDGKWAVGRDTRGYIHDYKRPAADFYRVNTATGERTLMFRNQLTGQHAFGISPHGTHFLYWKDSRFHAYDLAAGMSIPLGNGAVSTNGNGHGAGKAQGLSFVDTEFDHPGPKPSYGINGYTSDGRAVLVNHRYDLWLMPLDGSAPKNLTNGVGTKEEIRFRYIRVEPVDPTLPRAAGPRGTVDLSKPITLSAYGQWTKKAGFYELANGALKPIAYEDAAFSTPEKALKSDRFMFTRQTFSEYPDLWAGTPGKALKKITDANPQQKEYLWGRRILFDFKNKDGVRLQGILALPEDYKEGEKRPMIVTFYEKNSQGLHRYNAPRTSPAWAARRSKR